MMDDMTPDASTHLGNEDDSRQLDFGRYLKQVRVGLYRETLRDFAKRVGLSAGYIGKLEQGAVSVPRRLTVLSIAERLGIPPDFLLVKAGYASSRPAITQEHELILLKLRSIDPEFLPVVAEFLDLLAKRFPAQHA